MECPIFPFPSVSSFQDVKIPWLFMSLEYYGLSCFRTSPGLNGRHDLSELSAPLLTQSKMKHSYILPSSKTLGRTRSLCSCGNRNSKHTMHEYASAPLSHPIPHKHKFRNKIKTAQQQKALLSAGSCVFAKVAYDAGTVFKKWLKGPVASFRGNNDVLAWGWKRKAVALNTSIVEKGSPCSALVPHTPHLFTRPDLRNH